MTKDEVPFRQRQVKSHLLLPDDLDLTSVEDVVLAFAPELKPKRWLWGEVIGVALFLFFAVLTVITNLGLGRVLDAVGYGLLLISPSLLGWRLGANRVREYKKNLNDTPGVLFDEIASKFRREIKAHRRKVLGPDSEWQRARAPLLEAKDEANGILTHFRTRLAEDPRNEAARTQVLSAEELEAKFAAALVELDHRSDALLRFFNECEAKLPVLDNFRTDHEKSLALEKLKERADGTVADAQSALALIGQQFVSEALRMGQALGALERFEIKESAAFVPLDRIEHVADQILSSSREERETLAALMEKMEG